MDHYGVILRKLREINRLTVKHAAQKIGRSSGWISQIENGKGLVRLDEIEFERIVGLYNGEAYRKQFGAWISRSKINQQVAKEIVFDGSILKYLRNKAGLTLIEAAKSVGISFGHLSDLENGEKSVSEDIKNHLMKVYGYSPLSFRNFTGDDKRANNIPVRYKLGIALRKMSDSDIEAVFNFVNANIFAQAKKI
ncbi:MAG: hypothetical protein A4S09_13530 [Proteobacteria bacterium SG_bin7]|nr:MAG: hypothetical protein A4S09_13530 [Proteobacteria bacterium SG_bin7]